MHLPTLSRIQTEGKIKAQPDDFIVKEIAPSGRIYEIGGKYEYDEKVDNMEALHFILEKRNMDQFKAAGLISKGLGIRKANIGFAGTKDKYAITTQRMSISGATRKSVESLDIPFMKLQYLGKGDTLQLGDLKGNRFQIKITEIKDMGKMERSIEELSKRNFLFPNYFGEQRFGTIRPITHIVGREILKGDLKRAVETYITKTFPDEPEDAAKARKAAKKDLKKALGLFGRKYHYERLMISHIIENPEDYKGAIRKLPPNLQKMFVHAYQSYLFNKTLSILVKSGVRESTLEIPLLGHGFRLPKDRKLLDALKEVFREENISLQDFRARSMPDLASKGEKRRAFVRAENFKTIQKGKDSITLQFDLPKGSYATTFLKEIISL